MAHLLDRLADAGELRARGRRDGRVVDSRRPRRPRGRGARRLARTAIAPAAMRSEAAKTASMSGRAARSCSIAAAPPSWVKSAMRLEAGVRPAGRPRRGRRDSRRADRAPATMSAGPAMVAMRPPAAGDEVRRRRSARRRGCRRRRSSPTVPRGGRPTTTIGMPAAAIRSGSGSSPWRLTRSAPSTWPAGQVVGGPVGVAAARPASAGRAAGRGPTATR